MQTVSVFHQGPLPGAEEGDRLASAGGGTLDHSININGTALYPLRTR